MKYKCVNNMIPNSYKEDKIKEFDEIVVDSLESNFPKLNEDNPEVPSENNRSAALVMQAEIRVKGEKLISSLIEELQSQDKKFNCLW